MAAMIDDKTYIHEALSMDEVMVLFTIAGTLHPHRHASPAARAVILKARSVRRKMMTDPENTLLTVRVY